MDDKISFEVWKTKEEYEADRYKHLYGSFSPPETFPCFYTVVYEGEGENRHKYLYPSDILQMLGLLFDE